MSIEAYSTFDWDAVKNRAVELIIAARSEKSNRDIDIIRSPRNVFFMEQEVEQYFDYIKNTDHPLSYFIGRMSDDDLAEFICQLATTDFGKGNRKLLYNLGKEGMKYNFSSLNLQVTSVSSSNLSAELKEKMTKIQHILAGKDSYYNPKNREKDILDLIHLYWHKSYKSLGLDLIKKNDIMLRILMEEKAEAMNVGLDSVYYKRVSQYIDFSYVMFSEFLFYLVIDGWESNQKAYLEEIIKRMDDILELRHKVEMKMILYNYIENGKNTVPYQEILINENGETVSPAPQVFGLWIDKKQIWDEENLIDKVLEEDISKNIEFFTPPPPFLHNKISEYEKNRKLILELSGKNEVPKADYTKLEEAKQFIKIWNEKDGLLGNEDDVYLLYTVYREIFMNKVRMPDKNYNQEALTLARKLIKNRKLERWDEVFINKKIVRGRFCTLGLQEEYSLYNRVLQKCREALLGVFNILDDMECYRLIHDIGEGMIRISDIQ